MNQGNPHGPAHGQATTRTIAVAATSMQTLLDRGDGLPGIAVLSGSPGLGKTSAAVNLCHPAGFNANYICCRSFETPKSLILMLLKELGIAVKTHWPISSMFELICEAFAACGRPLVVDEVDRIAEKTTIELLRDLHDNVRTPLFLIGEENLKQKLLNHHERFHDRVLVWAKAMPADDADLAELIKHYAPDLSLEQGATRELLRLTKGVARRIVTALSALRQAGLRSGGAVLMLSDVQEVMKWGR